MIGEETVIVLLVRITLVVAVLSKVTVLYLMDMTINMCILI